MARVRRKIKKTRVRRKVSKPLAYYNEIDPFAAQWLRNLIDAGQIAPGIVDDRSIVEVTPNDLKGFTQCHFFAGIGCWSYALRLAGWDDSRPVWTGSPPCQPFSTAGRQLAQDDPRHLAPTWLKLVKACKPQSIFGEQVAAAIRHGWIDDLQDALEAEDYATGEIVLPGCSVGAPHIRQRLWFVAERMGDSNNTRSQGRAGVPECDDQLVTGKGSVVGGLADNTSAGWSKTQQDCGGGTEGNGKKRLAAGCVSGSADSGLADTDSATGREITGGASGDEKTHGQESNNRYTSNGENLRLADAECSRPEMAIQHHRRCGEKKIVGEASRAGVLRSPDDANAPPTGWNDPDWLFCRDGKWRPFEPIHVKMDDWHTSDVGQFRSNNQKESERINAILQGLREAIACASQGSRPPEQCVVELDDIVCLLPQSLSLAKLYGDKRTEEALQALQESISKAGPVWNASRPIQEIWASVGEKEKDRIRVGFDASRWKVVAPFPLASESKSRVGRLRGYGNAIIPQVAAEVIAATMEILDSDNLTK